MAGNNNPWRDILSPAEWLAIRTSAAAAGRAMLGKVLKAANTWPPTNKPAVTTAAILLQITAQVAAYDSIAKDDCALFASRIAALTTVKNKCDQYVALLKTTHLAGVKTPGQKLTTDPLDVWVTSLGHRAQKKAAYLQTMKTWHANAKPKYKELHKLTTYLMNLSDDNTRGDLLHATPYATIEKIDPFHRQTFVFLDSGTMQVDAVNPMGEALAAYLYGDAANTPDRHTNANPSFYEWLEYHPFCVGTPGVTAGYDMAMKSPNRANYGSLDLAYVHMLVGRMEYHRIVTNTGGQQLLNTAAFGASGKGPPDATAFVWDNDSDLWLHEHGLDGFVHASAKLGKKIRCSGMIVVQNGLAECITNQSGHYAPNARNIYQFVHWLKARNCVAPAATVKIKDSVTLAGTDTVTGFMLKAEALGYTAAIGTTYQT